MGVDGGDVGPDAPPPGSFPSQAEAESFIGEAWRDLLAAGVEQVSLFEGERKIYGPMSLRPPNQ